MKNNKTGEGWGIKDDIKSRVKERGGEDGTEHTIVQFGD